MAEQGIIETEQIEIDGKKITISRLRNRKPYARRVRYELIKGGYMSTVEFADAMKISHSRMYGIMALRQKIHKYEGQAWALHLGCDISDLSEIIKGDDIAVKKL